MDYDRGGSLSGWGKVLAGHGDACLSPSHREEVRDKVPMTHWPTGLANLPSIRSHMRDPVSKSKVCRTGGVTLRAGLWFLCTHMHLYAYTQVHTKHYTI